MKLINSLRVLLQIELIAIRKIYGATCAELDGHGTYWEGHVPGLGLLLPRQTDRAEDEFGGVHYKITAPCGGMASCGRGQKREKPL